MPVFDANNFGDAGSIYDPFANLGVLLARPSACRAVSSSALPNLISPKIQRSRRRLAALARASGATPSSTICKL
ncbi:hypothetical protein [Rhizobium lentis]|uniref:hypothetical protein n=1 Tax=Rhizobium lentis TaxID=1138194 RepID=UPI002180D951|nr:hypothetical protein [Rhizobium lentis]